MKLLVFSDIHSQKIVFPDIIPDLVLLLGDIDWRDVLKISNKYSEISPILGVLGNHDVLDTFNRTNVINVHEKVVEVGGFKIAGFGGCPRYNNKQNSAQYEEYEAERFIKNLGKVDIFIAHSNHKSVQNKDLTYSHRGFSAFTKMIMEGKTRYFFHGHIHENIEHQLCNSTVISTYGLRIYDIEKTNFCAIP